MQLGWGRELSRAVNRALRHGPYLPVNKLGFAWAEDLAHVLSHPPYKLREPTLAELLFTVVTEREGRFQAASRNGTADKGDIVIRCPQRPRMGADGKQSCPSAH